MCGFSGYIDFAGIDSDYSESIVRCMTQSISHRGPDGIGFYSDDVCVLGHARLSVIDVSGGSQPFSSEDGRYVLVFNGEIYNHAELREQLIRAGYKYRTHCDTETLLYAYMEWGEDCLQYLRGMFAFVVWDRKSRKVFGARDRLGLKPLYYCVKGSAIIFASELKSLLKHPMINAEVDVSAVVDYLRLGYCPAPKTAIKGVNKLQSASKFTFFENEYKQSEYWNVSDFLNFKSKGLSYKHAKELVFEELREAVKYRLESDVAIGGFLSGGLDSTMISSLASDLKAEPFRTQTVSFSFDAFDESPYAEEISNLLETDHEETFVGPDVARDLKLILWHMDEPFADDSAIPTFYLCKEAKKRMSVALSGDGADELFAGYSWYRQLFVNSLISRYLPLPIRRFSARLFPAGGVKHFRGKSFLENVGLSPEAQHVNLRTLFSDGEIQKIINSRIAIDEEQHPLRLLYDELEGKGDLVSLAQVVDIKLYLSEDILMKVDKMSMAHGLEVRAPFLDHVLVQNCIGFPLKFKLHKNQNKRVVRSLLKGVIPKRLLNRKKQGFGTPLAQWLTGELKDLVDYYLLDPRNGSGIFNHEEVAKLWKRFESNKDLPGLYLDLSKHVWCLLCFEIWYDLYINQCDK